MSLLDKLRALTSATGNPVPQDIMAVQVRCLRCGETLAGRINLRNDLSIDYDAGGYTVRKLLSGSGANRCFQTVELRMRFDQSRNVIDREITGGVFLEEPPAESA